MYIWYTWRLKQTNKKDAKDFVNNSLRIFNNFLCYECTSYPLRSGITTTPAATAMRGGRAVRLPPNGDNFFK